MIVSEHLSGSHDSENRCTICGAHIAEPHAPDCIRGDDADLEEDSLSPEECADMIVVARMEELLFMSDALTRVLDARKEGAPLSVASTVMTHIALRKSEIIKLRERKPDQ